MRGESEGQLGSRYPESRTPTFSILGVGGQNNKLQKPRKDCVMRREGCVVGVHGERGNPLASTSASGKRARDPKPNQDNLCLPDRNVKSRGQPEFR